MAKLDPTSAASKWATRMQGASAAYTSGVQGVTVAPGQKAAAAANLWVQNTTAAQSKFARNSSAVSLSEWQTAAANKGAQRLGTGATAAQPKLEAAFAKLFPYIQSQVSGLPARGDLGANIARMTQFVQNMAKYQK